MVIHDSDSREAEGTSRPRIHLTETRMPDMEGSIKLAQTVVDVASTAHRS
jgi:hypothetical protein